MLTKISQTTSSGTAAAAAATTTRTRTTLATTTTTTATTDCTQSIYKWNKTENNISCSTFTQAHYVNHDVKQSHYRPGRALRVPGGWFQDNRHMKVVMSALRTGRLDHPQNIPGTHFFWKLSRHHGHSAARRIMSVKNSNDTIGNRTRDLSACSPVPQPTAPPLPNSWGKQYVIVR